MRFHNHPTFQMRKLRPGKSKKKKQHWTQIQDPLPTRAAQISYGCVTTSAISTSTLKGGQRGMCPDLIQILNLKNSLIFLNISVSIQYSENLRSQVENSTPGNSVSYTELGQRVHETKGTAQLNLCPICKVSLSKI
jgi:hypothetical protein